MGSLIKETNIMKNIYLILAMLFLFTGCSEEKVKQQENPIYGTWKLTSFVNQSTDTILVESDFSNSNEITIMFKQELKFAGSTVRNSFSGNYSLKERDNKLLIVLELLATTKVNESEWGNLFYQRLKSNYNQTLENYENTYEIVEENSLKIFSSEQEYMTFKKL